MRILILNWKDLDDPATGGAETYVQRIACRWAQQGHEVTLLGPRLRGRPRHERRGGIGHVRVGNRLTVFHAARRHLRSNGSAYDLIVDSVSTRPFFAHRVCPDRALALYFQVADDVWAQEFAPPLAWIGRHVVEPFWLRRMRGARIVAVSDSTATDLGRHRLKVEAVVPPGWDVRATTARTSTTKPPKLVFLGRLVNCKRPVDAVLAFSKIRDEFPGATLDILGSGSLEARLREMAVPGVSVLGHVSEEEKSIRLLRADVLLMPATREGWAIVVTEAAGHGAPAVAYDVGGLRDSVIDGVTGVLTASTPTALAEAAIDLLRDEERWREMSRAGQSRAATLTWDAAAAGILAAWRPALVSSSVRTA